MTAFAALRDAFYRAHLAAEPEDATLLGAPGHDDRLRDNSPAGEAALRTRCRDLLADLARHVPADSLLPLERAELWSLRTYAEHHLRPPRRLNLEPLLLPYTVLQHQLARIAPAAEAWADVAARLRATPCFLEHALTTLSPATGIPLDRALAEHFARDLLPDAAGFLRDELLTLAPATLPTSLRTDLASAAQLAADAFTRAAAELAKLPTAEAYALGDDEVSWRLAHWYGHADADALCAAAEDELRAAQADLVLAADRHQRDTGGPGIGDLAGAMAVFRTVASRRLTSLSDCIPLYQQATERALALIAERRLFHLPEPPHLAFWSTPPAVRRVVGQASNWPAPLLRPGPAGFVVTLDPGTHAIAGAANLAVHEGIPGHGLQSLSWQQCFKGHPSPVAFLGLADDLGAARDYWAPHFNIEGWAVWCEHLMHDAGFLRPDEALFFHVSRAIRAMRVIADLGLARGRATREATAAAMAAATAMPVAWCEGQVLRYTRIPLQATTYRLGYLAFSDLERRCRAAWGPRFTLADFHAWALAWPPVPPAHLDPATRPA